MLWLGLHLPRLALDLRLRGQPGAEPALAIQESRAGVRRVHDCTAAAAAAGVRPGMAVNAALALAPELVLHDRDPAAEAAALADLGTWALRFGPLVSLEAPCALVLEIGASLALFGGLEALLARVREGLETLGYRVQAGVAPTPTAALLLARAGGGVVREPADLATTLHPLPLGLVADGRTLHDLEGLGLRTLGDLLRLPRAGLARRLGPELVALLDRALGRRPDPRPRHEPPPRFERRLEPATEITATEALLFPLRRLLLELGAALEVLGRGVQHLALELTHPQGARSRIDLELAHPGRDPARLEALFRQRLEACRLPAPVRALELRAGALVPLEGRSLALFPDPGEEQERWGRLLERIEARLGAGRVRGLALRADHRPERAWSPAADGAPDDPAPAPASIPAPAAPRPLWLLPAPRPLPLRDGHPWLGGRLRLRQGPERIESGWWDGGDLRRDYFVAENPRHERYWVFRELRAGGWFLHGLFA